MTPPSRVASQSSTPRRRARGSDEGATASEYALLMGFIAMVVAVGIGAFGISVDTWYNALATGVDAVLP